MEYINNVNMHAKSLQLSDNTSHMDYSLSGFHILQDSLQSITGWVVPCPPLRNLSDPKSKLHLFMSPALAGVLHCATWAAHINNSRHQFQEIPEERKSGHFSNIYYSFHIYISVALTFSSINHH